MAVQKKLKIIDYSISIYLYWSFGIIIDVNRIHIGPVAHLVERLTCTEEAAGSSPVRSTKT